MFKDCIICGGPTGSREHVFPAALGGRRTNKGIYCGAHNEGFSPYAAVLSTQLEPINAYLGVRPDHSDEPRRFEITDPSDGQRYFVSGSQIDLAEPAVQREAIVDGKRQVQMAFSNEQQIQEWITTQRAAGNEVQVIGRRELGRKFFTQPYKVQLKLGGLDGLRAIGYVALTFLAHHFPQTARDPGLKTFKAFVLGANDQRFVWWDFSVPADLPSNRFRFGHRVLIGLSAARREAYARVFLFSALSFAVHLGSVPVDADQAVVVDIDPHAEHPPDDIHETREQMLRAEVKPPDSFTESLRTTIENGEAQKRLESLFREVSDWQIQRTVEEILPKINASRSVGKQQRFPIVKDLLGEQEQRILNLMLNVVAGLKRQLEANGSTAAAASILELLVAGDANSPSGITEATRCSLGLAAAALADQICRDLEQGDLDTERLSALLGGAQGAAIVRNAMLGPLVLARDMITARTKG